MNFLKLNIGQSVLFLDSETTEELDQAVPKRKVYGSYLWKRANHPNRLKQQIDEKISQFVLHPLKFDDEYSNKFIDKEVKSLHVSKSDFC